MANTLSNPQPISWQPSSFWDGNDGSWNTFIVEVGSTPQSFRILPSTAGQETWVPLPEGCNSVTPSDPGYCGYLRGTVPVDGTNSSGFATNESSTWQDIGLFTLDAQENNLGYGGNGLFGFDTVSWGNSSNLTGQVVAGIATQDYWLGVAGIGPKTTNFTIFNDPISSYLSNLVNSSQIPSHSWAYTAGASYRNRSQASLTLGGYDNNRISGNSLSIPMNADNSRPLQLAVQKIVTQNSLLGTANLLPTSTYHFLDSTVPHLWLPSDAVSQFVSAFGLQYDNATDLYTINSTTHARLLDLNPTVSFVLAESTSSGASDTLSLDFPYAAFDLNASYPFYENATRYFPIRKAANESQYTLGRTFFQEAYVVADFERGNFSVAQASFEDLGEETLVGIEKPVESASANATAMPEAGAGGELSGGAIAGVVIGVVGGLAVVGLFAWFFVRRRRRQRSETESAEVLNTEGKTDLGEIKRPSLVKHHSELPSENGVNEVHGYGLPPEVDSGGISEAHGDHLMAEVDGDTAKWGRFGVQELHTPPIGVENRQLVEAPGDEGVRHELCANSSRTGM